MSASAFALLFAILLLATSGARLVLMLRQIRHVGQHRDAVPTAFAESISLATHQKAAAYTQARMRLGLVDVVVSALFVLVMTLGGGLDALSAFIATWLPAGGVWHGVVLIGALMACAWLIELPFDLVRVFGIEARFGFNRVTPALFVRDSLTSALLAALIGAPLLALILWLMQASGAWWWLWVWLVWLGFNVFGAILGPTLIAPLFNRFTPLDDASLRERIEALVARCGFRLQGLFVMDGSRRSAHGNAYFTGLGHAKRIVFYDTLLAKLQAAEIEAVLAHELGHFHHRHILQRLAVMAVAAAGLLALLAWLMQQPWFFVGLGVGEAGTATALALFMLVLPVFLFPLRPLFSAWSRKHEFEADRYAARHTSADELVSALVKLYRDNASTLTPDPLYSRVFDSHPPAAVRVAQFA